MNESNRSQSRRTSTVRDTNNAPNNRGSQEIEPEPKRGCSEAAFSTARSVHHPPSWWLQGRPMSRISATLATYGVLKACALTTSDSPPTVCAWDEWAASNAHQKYRIVTHDDSAVRRKITFEQQE